MDEEAQGKVIAILELAYKSGLHQASAQDFRWEVDNVWLPKILSALIPKGKPPLLSDEDWEKINQKSKDDVVGMVMDFQHNRITASELMDKIVHRCNLTAQAQWDICVNYEGGGNAQ